MMNHVVSHFRTLPAPDLGTGAWNQPELLTSLRLKTGDMALPAFRQLAESISLLDPLAGGKRIRLRGLQSQA